MKVGKVLVSCELGCGGAHLSMGGLSVQVQDHRDLQVSKFNHVCLITMRFFFLKGEQHYGNLSCFLLLLRHSQNIGAGSLGISQARPTWEQSPDHLANLPPLAWSKALFMNFNSLAPWSLDLNPSVSQRTTSLVQFKIFILSLGFTVCVALAALKVTEICLPLGSQVVGLNVYHT